MGASCSPDLVNLFAFYYEYRFLTSVLDLYRGEYLQQQQAKLLLLNIRFMRRFLDDIILPTVFPDRAWIHALFTMGGLVPGVHGIYPACLSIQDTSSDNGPGGEFMDLNIEWFQPTSGFHVGVFDKRQSPQYRAIPWIITVPSAHSCLSEICKWGVVFAQLWRFRLLCTTPAAWVQATRGFYIRFIRAGYEAHATRHRILRIIHRIAPFYGISNLTLRDAFLNAIHDMDM